MKGYGSAPTDHTTLPTSSLCVHISVNPSEAPKELVIPLIRNDPRRQPTTQVPSSSTDIEATADGVLSQAVKEIIEESKKSLEEKEHEDVDPMLAIPMIQNRCIPDEGQTVNLGLRQYPRMPITRQSLWRPPGWPFCRVWAGNLARALASL